MIIKKRLLGLIMLISMSMLNTIKAQQVRLGANYGLSINDLYNNLDNSYEIQANLFWGELEVIRRGFGISYVNFINSSPAAMEVDDFFIDNGFIDDLETRQKRTEDLSIINFYGYLSAKVSPSFDVNVGIGYSYRINNPFEEIKEGAIFTKLSLGYNLGYRLQIEAGSYLFINSEDNPQAGFIGLNYLLF